MRSSVVAAVAGVLVAAGPAASSATAAPWSTPVTLGEQSPGAVGDVDIQADGTAVVAWAVPDGAVRAAVRPAGGAFGTAVPLAPDGGKAVSVALDGGGGALVAWSRDGNLGLAERTAAAPALTEVMTGIAGVAFGPDVAFTGPGRAIVVWTGTDGAVHALSRSLGQATAPLADLAAGPGNLAAYVDAADGHAVAAWTHATTAGPQTTTTVRAATLAPGGSFGAAQDLATAMSDRGPPPPGPSGSELSAGTVVVSASGAADVLMTELHFMGVPGELAVTGSVAARAMGAWAAPQRLGGADLAIIAGRFVVDIAAGPAGDALYVEGDKGGLPTMTFSARLRSAGATAYGDVSPLHAGEPGAIRAAPLSAGRFLVLVQSGAGLRSREGSPATGFGDPLVFSGTDATRLLGLAGAPSGLAAAAWVTSGDRVHAAIYGEPEPDAGDTTDPRLTRLSVSPKRFTARRRARIRWRLSEPARVRVRVARVRPGYRRGGRCVARRPRSGRVRRCTRYRRVATLTRARQAGRSAVRFDRFVRRHDLRPGRYRITAVPRDAAGNRGRARRARFTLLTP